MAENWRMVMKYRWYILGSLLVLAMVYSLVSSLNRKNNGQVLPSPTATAEIPTASPSPTNTAPAAPSPSPAAGSITTTPAIHPSIDSSAGILYFLDADTVFAKRFNWATNETIELAPLSAFIEKLSWSPNHSKLLIRMENAQGNDIANPLYQDGINYGEIVTGLYDIESKKFTVLNQNIKQFAWLNDNEIIYQFNDGKFNNLSVSEPSGANWKNIEALKGDVEIIDSGNTALVKKAGDNKATRYAAGGKITEIHSLPTDFKLSQSSWQTSGKAAVYWVADGSRMVIKRLKETTTETLSTIDQTPDNPAILWDNVKGDVYVASLSGLVKVTSSQP